MEYYFADGDQQRGPYTLEALRTVGLKPDALVWHDGMPDWKPASTVPELAPLFAARLSETVAPRSAAPLESPIPLAAPPLAYQAAGIAAGNQNGMAIASLVLGIVALVTLVCDGFGLIPGILAIIFGILARKEIRQSKAQGYGMATAGLICGSIAVGLVVVIALVLTLVLVSRH